MIASIDDNDPPERPLTPVSFDPRNRSIQAKSSRGLCAGHAPGHATAVMGVRQRQGYDHEWNRGHRRGSKLVAHHYFSARFRLARCILGAWLQLEPDFSAQGHFGPQPYKCPLVWFSVNPSTAPSNILAPSARCSNIQLRWSSFTYC